MLDKLPASICPLVEGFGYDISESFTQSNISSGFPRFELWTTNNVAVYQLNFKLKYWQLRIFLNFYNNTLVSGSKWFTADLILNDARAPQELELHFLQDSTPQPRQIGNEFFQITMTAVARNPDFADDQALLNDINDLFAGGYSEEEINALLIELENFNNYLPQWWNE